MTQVQGELDAELADAATGLPGLEDKTVSVVRYSQGEFVYGPQGVAELEALGMQPAEGQPTSLADDPQSFSRENVDDLQADVVIIAVLGDPEGQADLEADPRVAELPAAQNGALFYFDATLAGAINPVSPASLRWWLEAFVPQLEVSPLNAGE